MVSLVCWIGSFFGSGCWFELGRAWNVASFLPAVCSVSDERAYLWPSACVHLALYQPWGASGSYWCLPSRPCRPELKVLRWYYLFQGVCSFVRGWARPSCLLPSEGRACVHVIQLWVYSAVRMRVCCCTYEQHKALKSLIHHSFSFTTVWLVTGTQLCIHTRFERDFKTSMSLRW